ncbi:MAG TPA: type IX secretion system membrane protein PorP/SprF [Chryseosolibacter sp.]
MKKIIFLLLLTSALRSHAQQDPLYTHYLFNPFIINPAYAGFSKDASIWASYRKQWAGFDGSPETKTVSGHAAFRDNRMGLGLVVLQDKIGNDRNTQVVASYAYHLLLKHQRKISFGLRGGFSNYVLDYSGLTIDDTDPRFQENISEARAVIGAGLIFSSDRFVVGLSVPNMLNTSTLVNGIATVLYNRHGYAQAAYVLPVSSRLKVKPFLLARVAPQSSVNFDLGGMLTADDSYSVGIFTRRLHTYAVFGKLNIGEALRLGYIFELPTNRSIGIHYPTHEFTLGLRIAFLRSHDLGVVADF